MTSTACLNLDTRLSARRLTFKNEMGSQHTEAVHRLLNARAHLTSRSLAPAMHGCCALGVTGLITIAFCESLRTGKRIIDARATQGAATKCASLTQGAVTPLGSA
eukprot:5530323-Amphidinium_carterae.1